jgi:hypothetical protein
VSDQNAEQSSGESGSLLSGSAGSDIWEEAPHPFSPATPPDAVSETTWVVAPHLQGPDGDTDASAPSPAESDAAKVGALDPSEVVTMSVGNYHERKSASASISAESAPKTGTSGRQRPALAAMVALATLAGALGGALATAGFSHFAGAEVEVANSANSALEASVVRIDADILALKSSLEHTAKLAGAQSAKAGERLDKLEKAQAEPAAKLARLSEAMDKLRAASPAGSPNAQNAAKEVTGSIASSGAAAPKAEVAKLPTVAGWKLRDVANGGALIESRQGLYEVYAGDAVPGLGRIDAIRRQDGHWVVVTAKGLVLPNQ